MHSGIPRVSAGRLAGAPVPNIYGASSLPGEPTSDRIIRMQMHREAERVLQTARDHVRATWPDLQITTAATDGVAAQSSVLGSVTHGVLHHATCPVAVVHPRESAT